MCVYTSPYIILIRHINYRSTKTRRKFYFDIHTVVAYLQFIFRKHSGKNIFLKDQINNVQRFKNMIIILMFIIDKGGVHFQEIFPNCVKIIFERTNYF